jgi:hypothetical protein
MCIEYLCGLEFRSVNMVVREFAIPGRIGIRKRTLREMPKTQLSRGIFRATSTGH